MTRTTIRHIKVTGTEHTVWCARDHRCNLREHRSEEIITDLGIHGRAILTRVRAGTTEYAEIRARIPLHANEVGARWQVAATLRLLRQLLASVAIRPGIRPADRTAVAARQTTSTRPAIEREAA